MKTAFFHRWLSTSTQRNAVLISIVYKQTIVNILYACIKSVSALFNVTVTTILSW